MTATDDDATDPNFIEDVMRLGIAIPSRRPLIEPPSRIVDRYLYPTERFRGEWRRHRVHVVKNLVVVVLYAALALWATRRWVEPRHLVAAVVAIYVGAVVLAGYCVLAWHYDRLVLTNTRLMVVRGALRRRVDSVSLSQVNDLSYGQSTTGRAFAYGTIRLGGVGWRSRLRRIVDVRHPIEIYLRLIEERYEPEAVEQRLRGAWLEELPYEE